MANKTKTKTKLNMSHRQASFATHFLPLKSAASSAFFSERNLCKVLVTLASDFPQDNHLISADKRRHLCCGSFSSQCCSNRHELSACALMSSIIILTTSFITL